MLTATSAAPAEPGLLSAARNPAAPGAWQGAVGAVRVASTIDPGEHARLVAVTTAELANVVYFRKTSDGAAAAILRFVDAHHPIDRAAAVATCRATLQAFSFANPLPSQRPGVVARMLLDRVK